ncbi:uncharacterized protein LOC144577829 [Callithrix jacchus]
MVGQPSLWFRQLLLLPPLVNLDPMSLKPLWLFRVPQRLFGLISQSAPLADEKLICADLSASIFREILCNSLCFICGGGDSEHEKAENQSLCHLRLEVIASKTALKHLAEIGAVEHLVKEKLTLINSSDKISPFLPLKVVF